jgi:membrane dipeptidase
MTISYPALGARQFLADTIKWDNHACMPLRPGDTRFLPQLERYRRAGVTMVLLNIHFGELPVESAYAMLATFRTWIAQHPDDYVLAETVADIEAAKRDNRLAIAFDLEGGLPVEAHPGLVEIFHALGVRWMLLAYNKSNRLAGGCQDKDSGLSDAGRAVIDEMHRVGMVLCCSHMGYRSVREAFEYSRDPVIFSHSNPRAVWDHPRNVPDDLLLGCARTGGVINICGFGLFMGPNDASTETLIRHIDYAVSLVGPQHVGLGLDYVFDAEELDAYYRSNPELFPPEQGYCEGVAMVEPERIPVIADTLVRRGYALADVAGILGHNNLRVARQVWK